MEKNPWRIRKMEYFCFRGKGVRLFSWCNMSKTGQGKMAQAFRRWISTSENRNALHGRWKSTSNNETKMRWRRTFRNRFHLRPRKQKINVSVHDLRMFLSNPPDTPPAATCNRAASKRTRQVNPVAGPAGSCPGEGWEVEWVVRPIHLPWEYTSLRTYFVIAVEHDRANWQLLGLKVHRLRNFMQLGNVDPCILRLQSNESIGWVQLFLFHWVNKKFERFDCLRSMPVF